MSKRVVIDPITRIEGHLRIEVELDAYLWCMYIITLPMWYVGC